jgi:hypothetical protein
VYGTTSSSTLCGCDRFRFAHSMCRVEPTTKSFSSFSSTVTILTIIMDDGSCGSFRFVLFLSPFSVVVYDVV